MKQSSSGGDFAVPLVQTVYHSEAVTDASAALPSILATARRRNVELGITGALLCGRGRFAQVLEGPEKTVAHLMDLIRKDARHGNVMVVTDGARIRNRFFADWAMACLVSDKAGEAVRTLVQDAGPAPHGLQGECVVAVLRWLVEGGPECPEPVLKDVGLGLGIADIAVAERL